MQVFDNKNQFFLNFYAEKSLLVYKQANLFYFTLRLISEVSRRQVEGNTYPHMFHFSFPIALRST